MEDLQYNSIIFLPNLIPINCLKPFSLQENLLDTTIFSKFILFILIGHLEQWYLYFLITLLANLGLKKKRKRKKKIMIWNSWVCNHFLFFLAFFDIFTNLFFIYFFSLDNSLYFFLYCFYNILMHVPYNLHDDNRFLL